jgi:hypothetical protein
MTKYLFFKLESCWLKPQQYHLLTHALASPSYIALVAFVMRALLLYIYLIIVFFFFVHGHTALTVTPRT